MFTGIIHKLTPIQSMEIHRKQARLKIMTDFDDLRVGESISINGCCLTVEEVHNANEAVFFISSETLLCTNLGDLKHGTSRVNLERALQGKDRLEGHIVQGHIDGVAELRGFEKKEDSFEMEIRIPPALSHYCVLKGSVALNGVSLTINSLTPDYGLVVCLIPHTWKNTNLQDLRPGDRINVEVDVIAKYVEKLCQPYLKP